MNRPGAGRLYGSGYRGVDESTDAGPISDEFDAPEVDHAHQRSRDQRTAHKRADRRSLAHATMPDTALQVSGQCPSAIARSLALMLLERLSEARGEGQDQLRPAYPR